MSIQIHCDYCGKKVEAPDNAGGKWGKCPSCHNKLYIPDLSSDEEIKLVPIDESEEQRKKQLMEETFQLEQKILLERETPDETTPTKNSQPTTESTQPATTIGEKELTKNIILYFRYAADDQTGDADQLINLIAPHNKQALQLIDRIALSEIPEPELADIPPQVLAGLIRTLRNKIS